MGHTAHPDVHETGLADDCLACAEHAEKPFHNLDAAMLADLAHRAVERASGRPVGARSYNEAVAETAVVNLLEQVGRLAEVAPAELERYLHDRWRIDCQIRSRFAAS